jgi:FixJ family two-component response regulator
MISHAEGRDMSGHSKPVVTAVDDDARVRASIQSVLESAGYEAVVFASAEAFLESGVLRQATCLLADVRLPGMDGLELQRRIRRARPQLPIIFITAHDDEHIRQQALQDGAVDFLVKPFDAAQLLNSIEAVANQTDDSR